MSSIAWNIKAVKSNQWHPEGMSEGLGKCHQN